MQFHHFNTMKTKLLFLLLLTVCSICFGQIRCLIIEKLSDGQIQAKAYINVDGSATITTYKNAQEAALALPLLDKSATNTVKDPDRVVLTIDPSTGAVTSSIFQVASTGKGDAGESSLIIQEATKTKVLDLANDLLVKDGKPIISTEPVAAEGDAEILTP